ncbi:MAG: hypothetical protein JSR87_02955 [Proteobacteria bacterium]|nr:hypothetical protein [Pseudomonadota bacterium]MBS0573666.1 hypothetical protein [Pseudomonadota bacterium]
MRVTGLGLALALATLPLAGCIGFSTFQTYYEKPVPAAQSRGWHVVAVNVDVPAKLTVSEDHSYEPKADIVWREDPIGDRHPQVAKILKDAITRGAAGLHGPRPVRLDVVVSRFHALTYEAETLNVGGIGVHNVNFTISVVDARSGAVLVPPEDIDAAMPALTGVEMIKARERGESQKSQIEAHVAATIAGWLGLGPDQRDSFVRAGM